MRVYLFVVLRFCLHTDVSSFLVYRGVVVSSPPPSLPTGWSVVGVAVCLLKVLVPAWACGREARRRGRGRCEGGVGRALRWPGGREEVGVVVGGGGAVGEVGAGGG